MPFIHLCMFVCFLFCQLAIMNLINNYQDPSRPIQQSGFWIALRDGDEEGMWRWVGGTRLSEG